MPGLTRTRTFRTHSCRSGPKKRKIQISRIISNFWKMWKFWKIDIPKIRFFNILAHRESAKEELDIVSRSRCLWHHEFHGWRCWPRNSQQAAGQHFHHPRLSIPSHDRWLAFRQNIVLLIPRRFRTLCKLSPSAQKKVYLFFHGIPLWGGIPGPAIWRITWS